MEAPGLILKIQSLESQLKILRAELDRPRKKKKAKVKTAKGALKGMTSPVDEEEFLKARAAWRSVSL